MIEPTMGGKQKMPKVAKVSEQRNNLHCTLREIRIYSSQVKNKAPASIQITAEQLLREAKERELENVAPVSNLLLDFCRAKAMTFWNLILIMQYFICSPRNERSPIQRNLRNINFAEERWGPRDFPIYNVFLAYQNMLITDIVLLTVFWSLICKCIMGTWNQWLIR